MKPHLSPPQTLPRITTNAFLVRAMENAIGVMDPQNAIVAMVQVYLTMNPALSAVALGTVILAQARACARGVKAVGHEKLAAWRCQI